MKQFLLFTAVAVATFYSCSEDTLYGSGYTTSEFRTVNDFNKVSSEGTFVVSITKGTEQSVEIIADDNLMHRVKTKVQNGKLKIYLENGNYSNTHLEANITVADLSEVENNGVGHMYVFNATGVSSFKATNTGTANIYIEGSCNDLNIFNEGSGNILAFEMPSDYCKVYNRGSGEIEVNCTSNLDVTIVGSGNIHYVGNPQITAEIEGSGEIVNEN